MKTLKVEEVDGSAYRDIDDARGRIGEFIERVYNRQRLHSALRYLSPEEFETRQFHSSTAIHSGRSRGARTAIPTTTVTN